MKTLVLLLAASVFCAIPERIHNQEALTGAFNFNGLPEPQTVSLCGDDDTQIKIFNFVGYYLNKVDTASVTEYTTLEAEATEFYAVFCIYIQSLPQDYKDCYTSNQEMATFWGAYGITAASNPDDIKAQVKTYVLLHFLASKKTVHSANVHWNTDKNYYQTGYELAEFLKKALA